MSQVQLPQRFAHLSREDRNTIDGFIRDARSAREQELAEKRKNPSFVMQDDPKPTLSRWLEPALGFLENGQELIQIWSYGRIKEFRLTKGTTTYQTSWLTWPAFKPTMRLLKDRGLSEEAAYNIVTDRFPFVYGVITIPRLWRDGETFIFCGIRSQNLAGVNTGMVSFPAGLVNPGENIGPASLRELFEEWNEDAVSIRPGFAIGLHDNAPSCSFVSLAETESERVRESFEWKGGKGIWVPERAIREALEGYSEDLAEEFRKNGMDVADDIRIATDAVEPAKELLLRVFKSRDTVMHS
jgi:ADP-ribose pyrophosphatase YjhB (NUDIX family)